MHVYLDLRCFQDDGLRNRGVGYHSQTLLQSARDFLPSGSLLVGLTDSQLKPIEPRIRSLVDDISTVFAPRDGANLSAFVQFSPMTHDPFLASRFHRSERVFKAAVIYDFIPLEISERYLTTDEKFVEYAAQIGWLQAYNHLLPISVYSSARLQQLLPIPTSALDITGVALRPAFQNRMERLGQGASLANQSSGDPYVLCVAGGDPRKNVELIVEAHARLNRQLPNLKLVIVGAYGGRQISQLEDFSRKSGGDPRQLHFYHGIGDNELADLYQNALVSVSCSEAEGFSLPVIEAIACGCPMLVSDNAAHRELISNRQQVFDVGDSQQLASKIEAIATNPTLRQATWESQRDVPHRFTSQLVSQRFWTPICRGIRNLKALHRGRPASIRRNRSHRPRVAILSPFPPDASGVADYTRRTVQALGKLVDVDVFTETAEPTPTPEVRNFFPLSELPYTSGAYDNVLAVVGNSHFHTRIIELQQRYGGPCLIHDNRLAELYAWWKGLDYVVDMAERFVGRRPSAAQAQYWIDHPGELPSMFFGELVDCSQPLIVHSKGIQRQCLKEHGIEPHYLPFCCYREFDAAQLTRIGQLAARDRLGIPEDQFMVISLGIVAPTKGPEPSILAISRLRQAGIEAHLYFVGTAGPIQSALMDFAKSHQVESQIHFSGDWVKETTYQDYVIAADAAVQLRNHFFGGLSGAMLDCIASGLTTIANQDLAEALDSPANVLRVSDDLVPEEISQALEKVVAADTYRDRLSVCRERYLEEHSFERYAEKLLQVLGIDGVPTSQTHHTQGCTLIH